MKKDLKKLLLKIILLILIIWIIFIIIVKNFGMYIFDGEYSYYKQTMDYVSGSDEYNEILIFGDSVVKSAILPNELCDSCYNLAMAGSSPIEQYYLMQEYFENHEKPKKIVMMYFQGEVPTIDNFFWNRVVYFDCISLSQFFEIYNTESYPYDIFSIGEFLQYKLCFPNKYYAALKNSLFTNRKEVNEQNYIDAENSKGQHYFGTAQEFGPNNNQICEADEYDPLDLNVEYFYKCIDLALENDIEVLVLTNPINISTLVNMKDSYKESYIKKSIALQEKYPDIIVDAAISKDFYYVPNDWFGDTCHLNERGAKGYTALLKENYSEFFTTAKGGEE